MPARAFSRANIIAAIADGTRRHDFFANRYRTIEHAGVLPVTGRTAGAHARYGDHARVMAVVCNALLDWGLSHPQRLPESFRSNPSISPFWAVAEALDGQTIDFITNGARNGQDWLLRIDRITGQGEPRFLARAYPINDDRNYGETPAGCDSTLSFGLRPLIAHLLEEG